MKRRPGWDWLICLGVALVLWATEAPAATFTVNSIDDSVDAVPGDGICETDADSAVCTLRAAIQETNALQGPDEVIVPPGSYVLSLVGANEDDAETGDLDVLDELVLTGAGADMTVTDGNATDRVFHIHSGASATIYGVTIQNGSADFEGGGIFNEGVMTLTNSTVRDNYANGWLVGGGIANSGTMTVTNSTVRDNYADGGGIANSGMMTVTNSTVAGGIFNGAEPFVAVGTLTLTSSTVSEILNGVEFLGILPGGQVTVTNTIIGGCYPPTPVTSGGHNLDETGNCGLTAEGDLSNVDAGLASLGDYGGPTATQALLADSPAIDAGDNDACPSADQRGVARPQEAGCDIGAFELAVRDCGNGVLDFGEQCDDGNLIAGDGCSSVCGIECGDGLLDPNEECDDGSLIDGDGCSSTCEIEWCNVSAEWECRTASDALLLLRQRSDGTRDKLLWKLSGGEATSQEEFADPTENTGYVLCLEADGSRVAECDLPASSSKWKGMGTRGYRYKDKSGAEDGIQKILLRGSQHNTKVVVKGKGANLPDPALPLEPPVTVRLVNANTGVCWESTFLGWTKNEAGIFWAKKDDAKPPFTVTKTDDTNDGSCDADCSLREAINAANSNSFLLADVVIVPAGTYLLTLEGEDDDPAVGDLNITEDLTLIGAGAEKTVIDGNETDGVFAIATGASVSISGVTIQNGRTQEYGGGIINFGTLMLTNSTVRDNWDEGQGGGGIACGGCTLTLNNSTVSGNTADVDGGGIGNLFGTVTLNNSTVSGNTAGRGGGIGTQGRLTLNNSTVSGNTADTDGGGIANRDRLTLNNSTVSSNTANSGGGIFNVLRGSPRVSTATLTNSIIANNSGENCAGSEFSEPITSGGHNLDDDGSCGLTGEGDLSGVAAHLAPLGDYGGPTDTHALCTGPGMPDASCMAASPALDAGDNKVCPDTDQRGVERPQPPGGFCDIGAYEAE